jgi:glycoprotease/Kae1 family metallohydrolase
MSLLGSGSTSSAFLRQLYRQPPRVAHCFSHSSRAALNARGERLVLGIETSCDDSCVSLVRAPLDYGASLAQGKALPEGGEAHVVASVVLRQDHGATGGIEPLQAAHEHAARLPSALLQALEQARYTGDLSSGASQVPSEIDAIAVTQGPGMSGCLSSGLAMAKTLSALWKRPLLYVHHMAAHALTPFLTSPSLRFPYLSLLLSGGHSQLVLVRGLDDYEILADATDGAIGNAFDKVARNLDAIDEWGTKPPGLQLEELAAQGIAHEHWAQVQRARRGLPLDPSVPTPKQVAAQRLRERKTEGREEMLQQRETGVKEDETGQEKNEPKEKGAMEGPKEQEDVELPPPIPPLMRGLPIPFRGVPAFSL